MLPSMSWPVSAACLVCRKRHLKCDGKYPCSRCTTAGLDCVYVASRRGYNGRQRNPPQLCGPQEAKEPSVTVAALPAATIGPDLVTALEFPHFDLSVFSGIAPIYADFDTSLQVTPLSQPNVSTSLPVYSLQNPLGGMGNLDLGFSLEVPQARVPKEHYLDSFYQNFYAAHPFIPPKDILLILAQEASLEPLIAAMRWIGSLYIEKGGSHGLLREALRLVDGNPIGNGFLVQAKLLLTIGLDGDRQRAIANKLMSGAQDIAIAIGMNTRSFATTNGQGIPILEESWRRTWWELYVVDALMSGVHQTNTFALYDVAADVALPCEEDQFLSGQIPPEIHERDDQNVRMVKNRPLSSYAYRVQCACFFGTLQKIPERVEHVDKLLSDWMLRLPTSKYDAYHNGQLDEMMFQAIMMWHAISILLHQPHSQLDPSATYHIKACAPNTPAESIDAFNRHTIRTIRAARELSKLINQRVPLLRHTHFFSYMLTLSCTIHLSRWPLAFVSQDDEDLRQHMRQNIGALAKYAETWPIARHLGCQVKQIAKEVYMMKKRGQQNPSP